MYSSRRARGLGSSSQAPALQRQSPQPAKLLRSLQMDLHHDARSSRPALPTARCVKWKCLAAAIDDSLSMGRGTLKSGPDRPFRILVVQHSRGSNFRFPKGLLHAFCPPNARSVFRAAVAICGYDCLFVASGPAAKIRPPKSADSTCHRCNVRRGDRRRRPQATIGQRRGRAEGGRLRRRNGRVQRRRPSRSARRSARPRCRSSRRQPPSSAAAVRSRIEGIRSRRERLPQYLSEATIPTTSPLIVALGQMKLETNHPDDAIDQFQNALKADPTNGERYSATASRSSNSAAATKPSSPLTARSRPIQRMPKRTAFAAPPTPPFTKTSRQSKTSRSAIELNPDDYESYFTLGIAQHAQ